MSEMFGNPCGPVSGNDCAAAQINTHLEGKDKDQLLDGLVDLLDSATNEDFDVDQLDAYLAALDEIDPLPFEIDTEASLAAFKEKHAVLMQESIASKNNDNSHMSENNLPISEKKHSRFVFRKILPIAATMAMLMGTMVTAQAFGLDVFGTIARWTSETFRFQSEDIPYATITMNPLSEGEKRSFDSLQAALDAFGVSAPLAPKQLPSQFVLVSVNAVDQPSGILIYADYVCEDEFFQIRFKESDEVDLSSLENESTRVTLYPSGGIDHYLLTDQGCQKAIWQNGKLECWMFGCVSEQEMEEIIESIYD